jgi:hypothetical protein
MWNPFVRDQQMEQARSARNPPSRALFGEFVTTQQGPADEPVWNEFRWLL